MIVRLLAPDRPDGPWRLFTDCGEVDFIDPPAPLRNALQGLGGYFHADRVENGWAIGEAAPDQGWELPTRPH
jgi:hypothetical protein